MEENYSAPQQDAPINSQESQQMPPVHEQQPKKKGMGPAVGIVVIIILLLIGGLYFWGAKLNSEVDLGSPENIDITNSQDEPQTIEDDLEDFDSATFEAQMEADIKAMESEL